MRFLPADLTPLSPLLKKIDQWTQPDKGVFKKHILSRGVTVVATPPLALISSLYNTLAFTVKAPIVLVRYTVLLIPIKKDGRWRTVGSLLPDSLGFKELAKHAAKIFAYAIDVLFSPLLGLASPRANIWVHEKLGLMTPREARPVNPFVGVDGAVNPSTNLLADEVTPLLVTPKDEQKNEVLQPSPQEQEEARQHHTSSISNSLNNPPAPEVTAVNPPPPPPPPPKGTPANKDDNGLADSLKLRRRRMRESNPPAQPASEIAPVNTKVSPKVDPVKPIVRHAPRENLNAEINAPFQFRNHINVVEKNGVNVKTANEQAAALAVAIPVVAPVVPRPSVSLRPESEWA